MYCINCGTDLPTEAKFCPNCAKQVIQFPESKSEKNTNSEQSTDSPKKESLKQDKEDSKKRSSFFKFQKHVSTRQYGKDGITYLLTGAIIYWVGTFVGGGLGDLIGLSGSILFLIGAFNCLAWIFRQFVGEDSQS